MCISCSLGINSKNIHVGHLFLYKGILSSAAMVDIVKNPDLKKVLAFPLVLGFSITSLILYLPFLPYDFYKDWETRSAKMKEIHIIEKQQEEQQKEQQKEKERLQTEYKKQVDLVGVACTKCGVKYLKESLYQTKEGVLECEFC